MHGLKLPVLNHTYLANYENCPRKAWHVNIARDLPQQEKTDAQDFGTFVHEQMALHINKHQDLPASLAALESFCHPGPPYVLRAEGKLGMREDGSSCSFFAPDVWFRGAVDVHVKNPQQPTYEVIWDWKTGKPREDPTELKRHALLLKALNPKLQRVTGSYIWTREAVFGRSHDLSNFEMTLQHLKTLERSIKHSLTYGVDGFQPDENPLCPWCPVLSCPFNKAPK